MTQKYRNNSRHLQETRKCEQTKGSTLSQRKADCKDNASRQKGLAAQSTL